MTCAFCLQNELLRDDQILLRGQDLYLCAPRGQLVEGYLAIAPYQCIGSLSQVPAAFFDALARFKNRVLDFYEKAYRSAGATFYEQGRAGGGLPVDPARGFPLHAHFCSLPLEVDLHAALADRYAQEPLSAPHELAVAARNTPYVYVESMGKKVVYLARDGNGRDELERMRLKPMIATLLGIPERGYWQAYPGDLELSQLISRWRQTCQT
jgi:diadenosine tetraphosphate (Ap4A) HIT family hydrolase